MNEAERAELQSRLEVHQKLDRRLGRGIVELQRELKAPGELTPEYRKETEETITRSEVLSVALQGHIARFKAWLAEGADTETRNT